MAQKLMYLWQMNFTQHKTGIVIFLLAFVFNSCKNDLKLNAPYKEVPSIYAVINPQDKIQIIRVNKVFLGEGNANDMAQVADSINYQPGDLTITLSRFVNGTQVDACPTCAASDPDKKTITFRDSVVQAVPGAFNTQQRVYVSSAELRQGFPTPNSNGINTNPNWKVSGDYVLTVKNNKTGNIFTSKTTAVDSVSGNQFSAPIQAPFYPYAAGTSPNSPPYIDYSAQNSTFFVTYAPRDGTIYQVIIRLHFYDVLFNGNKDYKYVDYTLGNQYSKDAQKIAGQSVLRADFKGKDVFAAAGIGLSKMNLNTSIIARKMYKIQYMIYSSTNDYSDYLQFVAPSLNISQSKPLYSNFDDRAALGIFTFRSRCSVTKEMSTSFVSEFQSNTNTCSYQFYNYDESRQGCN